MKSSAKKVELASVDDLFSTEESRADAQEVATMDDTKKQLLKDIFWQMNEIFIQHIDADRNGD